MTLLQGHERAIARMQSLQAGRGDIDVSQTLRQFSQEQLLPALAGLARIKKAKTALEGSNIQTGLTSPSKNLREAATALRERFEREPVRSTLVDGKGWVTVKPSLQAYTDGSQQELQTTWTGYCDAGIPADTPQQLRADSVISLHRENRAMLQQYESLYNQLLALKSSLPTNAKTVEQFDKAAREAAALLGQLNRKPPSSEALPPSAVLAFLQQVSVGPVALDKVPLDVLDWLRANDRLRDYQVRVCPT